MDKIIHNDVRRHRFLGGQMTPEQPAAPVGVSRHTIIAIEMGAYDPAVALALRIARVFGVAVEEVCRLEAQGKDGDVALR